MVPLTTDSESSEFEHILAELAATGIVEPDEIDLVEFRSKLGSLSSGYISESLESARKSYSDTSGHKLCPSHSHESLEACPCVISCQYCYTGVPEHIFLLDEEAKRRSPR